MFMVHWIKTPYEMWHTCHQTGPTFDDMETVHVISVDVAFADWSDDVADDCAELLVWLLTG